MEDILKNTDPDLNINTQAMGLAAINPFLNHNSSPRLVMCATHLSQIITLRHGDERIITTGIEKQLGNYTFSKVIPGNSKIIKVIPRYKNVGDGHEDKITGYYIIFENMNGNEPELDFIEITKMNKTHTTFGFTYIWDQELIDRLVPGTIIKKDTVIAYSPTVTNGDNYKFGLNANLALLPIPSVSEDGVVISKSFANRLSFDYFNVVAVEFGAEFFPLNIYGDEDNYKPFPDIGDKIADNGVIAALRKYESDIAPALNSKKDILNYNQLFDNVIYSKYPGEVYGTDGELDVTAEVIDIKVVTCPKNKKNMYTGISDFVDKYLDSSKRFYSEVIDTYKEYKDKQYKQYRKTEAKISNRLHKAIVESYAIANPDGKRIEYGFRNEPMDIYRVEFTIRYRVHRAVCGMKLSDCGHGSKGVIVDIWDDEAMPMSPTTGERADLIMEPASVVNRMNIGRIYEHYFTGSSRKTKWLITSKYGKDITKYSEKDIDDSFNIILGLLKILDTIQYKEYKKHINNFTVKRDIVKEAIEKEVFIYYSVDCEKKAYEIVNELKDSPYGANIEPVTFIKDGKTITTKGSILIAPMYIILLNKTAEHFICSSSCKTNHFGILVSHTNKEKMHSATPQNPSKNLSETEPRILLSYCNVKLLAELQDRANNVTSHEVIYHNILTAPNPTNIDKVINRDIYEYGANSAPLKLINSIFNAAGIQIVHTEDRDVNTVPI